MPFDFKSIKSLFIVEEEKPGNPQPKEDKASPSKTDPDPNDTRLGDEETGRPGEVSDKFLQVLFGAMEKANLPGMDYLEYKQSLRSLEKMPMEDGVRYQSAFAMAQTMGATPKKLIESANHYLDVLKGEQSKFEQALAKQNKEKVGGPQEKFSSLEAVIQQKEEQIRQLTQEIKQHQQEMEQIRLDLKEATSKIRMTHDDFIASYNTLVAKILGDVENMKKYLK